MKNVEILNEKKQLLKRYRELSLEQRSLNEACQPFGPGKYYVSYTKAQNTKQGKPGERRAKKKVFIEVYVYEEDYPEEIRQQFLANMPQKSTVMVVGGPQSRAGALTADSLREIIAEAQMSLLERLSVVESDEEEDEEEEDEEEENPFFSQLVAISQKPEYARLVAVLFSNLPDENKFAEIDAAFAADPTIKHKLFADALSLLPQGFA